MKIKTGTLLVIGSLILLVALTVFLTPSPPPAAPGHEDEEAAKAKEANQEKPKEAPKVSLDQIQKLIASDNSHAQKSGFEELAKLAVLTRDAVQKQVIIDYAIKLARTDPRDGVRVGAVSTLQGIEEVNPEPLLSVVKNDRSLDVRKAGILALAKFPPGGEVEQALRQYAKDPDPGLRALAVISLTQMMSAAGQAGAEQLVQLLGEPENDVSAKASMNLKVHGAPALPMLIDALYKGKTGPRRHAAAMTIGLICAGFSPSIEAFAKQAQVTHRQEAEHRLPNLQGLQPLLWALQNDPYAPTREIAAQGLGYIGDERAAAPLAAALKDPDAYVRRRAAAALVTVPAAAVVPQLSETATKDKAPEVRRFAVEALGWVGGPQVIPALNQATADESPIVRRYAAIQLGRLALAKDETQAAMTPELRASVVQALSGLLDETPDPDSDVRWAAVVALGRLHDKAAQSVLVRALGDTSPQVANSAERALQRLGIARRESEGFEG